MTDAPPDPREALTLALAYLLSGRSWIVVKPRDPERPMMRGGFVIHVEERRR